MANGMPSDKVDMEVKVDRGGAGAMTPASTPAVGKAHEVRAMRDRPRRTGRGAATSRQDPIGASRLANPPRLPADQKARDRGNEGS